MMNLWKVIAIILVTGFFLVGTSSASPSSRDNDEFDIKESLEFIINHPLNKERPASYLLGPPLTEEEIILTLQPVLENKDVEQLVQLYKATNGLKTLDADGHPLKDIWLIPGYYLLSLHEMVDTVLTLKKISDVWTPSWLPLFASSAGSFLVYDAENGHIHELLIRESLLWNVAPNLKSFLHGIARKLRDGRILLNENGLYDEISKEAQTNDVYEHKMVDDLYLSARINNSLNLEILVQKEITAYPGLEFDCSRIPKICQNIINAKRSGQPSLLQRITDKKQIDRNRRASCGKAKCKLPNNSCDEYPFASTSQGGAGATIMCVPLSENKSQGGQLKKFYLRNKVNDKDWFYMKSP